LYLTIKALPVKGCVREFVVNSIVNLTKGTHEKMSGFSLPLAPSGRGQKSPLRPHPFPSPARRGICVRDAKGAEGRPIPEAER